MFWNVCPRIYHHYQNQACGGHMHLHSLPNAIGKSAAVVPLTRYSDQSKGTSSISSRLDLMVKSIEQHCAMPKAHLKLNWINLLKCNYCDNIHTWGKLWYFYVPNQNNT